MQNNPGTVLIMAYYYPPQRTSGAARPARMARYLAKLGHKVEVISADLPGMSWEAGVRRVPISAQSGAPVPFGKLAWWIERKLLPYTEHLPWVPYAVEAGSEVCHHSSVTVLSTSPPVGAHLAAMELKRRFGVRWIADFRDPLRGNPFRSRRWAAPYDAVLERLILTRADAVLANTDSFAGELRRRYPRQAHKVSVMWNGYDPEEDLRPLPCPPGPKTLVHVGSLYGPRHPGVLAASLGRLLSSGHLQPGDFRVELIGPVESLGVSLQEGAFRTLREGGALRVVDEALPRVEAQKAAAEAHGLLLLDLNKNGGGLQVPAKLFEYLRIGRPILAFTSAGSPVERILLKAAVPHIAIDPGEAPGAIDDKVASFFRLPAEPSRASDWFWSEFDPVAQAVTLSSMIRSRTTGESQR